MSERLSRMVLGVVSGLVLLSALAVELPVASDARFWSDAATYYAMAGSLAFDGDLEFTAQDLSRVRASYPGGPQGVFLKRVPARGGGTRLVYGKPLVYPAAGAPFVRLLGADRGLLLLNAAVLVASLWLGFLLLRATGPVVAALAGTLAVFFGGVAPIYLLWQTPEIFNLGLVVFAFFAWRRGHPLLGAALLGAAAYAKPTNAALALPLLVEPLLGAAHAAGVADAGWRRRVLSFAQRGAILGLVFAAGFGLNWVGTGEPNYQGGERKTFYDRYPFEDGIGFDSAGVWMTTDHVGPLVAGRDEDKHNAHVAPPRSRAELRQAFCLNLLLFWIGRFGGALPYYPGVAIAAILFLVLGPRDRTGWLALGALLVSWLGYILLIPDNWYGGAGTIGNRYFVNLVPLGLLLLPRGRGLWAALLALPVTAALLGPLLLSPVQSALRPGSHAVLPAFRMLPAELTMLGDLSVFTDVWRKRRPYNAPGGDPARRPAGAPPAFFLWFLDDGSFGQESSFGEEGFWLRGGESTEVVVQALAPVRAIRLVVTSGPAGDILTARLGPDRQRLVMGPLETRHLVFEPRVRPVGYYGTELFRLRLGSRFGAATTKDPRKLGSFVRIVLEE